MVAYILLALNFARYKVDLLNLNRTFFCSHHPIDWNLPPNDQPHPLAAQEPRSGRRLTLAADICTPQGLMRVYCCHLEVREELLDPKHANICQ